MITGIPNYKTSMSQQKHCYVLSVKHNYFSNVIVTVVAPFLCVQNSRFLWSNDCYGCHIYKTMVGFFLIEPLYLITCFMTKENTSPVIYPELVASSSVLLPFTTHILKLFLEKTIPDGM